MVTVQDKTKQWYTFSFFILLIIFRHLSTAVSSPSWELLFSTTHRIPINTFAFLSSTLFGATLATMLQKQLHHRCSAALTENFFRNFGFALGNSFRQENEIISF